MPRSKGQVAVIALSGTLRLVRIFHEKAVLGMHDNETPLSLGGDLVR
jgi:hypothetical protein